MFNEMLEQTTKHDIKRIREENNTGSSSEDDLDRSPRRKLARKPTFSDSSMDSARRREEQMNRDDSCSVKSMSEDEDKQ